MQGWALEAVEGAEAQADYKLPDEIASAAQEQNARDVARLHGGPVVSQDAEYKAFLAELGGAPPPHAAGSGPGPSNGAPPSSVVEPVSP